MQLPQFFFIFFYLSFPEHSNKPKQKVFLEKCCWDIFTTKKKNSNGPFTLRGALNCTLTMNFVKSFVLIHALILIPLVVWL